MRKPKQGTPAPAAAPKLAAIDVGSNAIRMAVAELGENNRVILVKNFREAVRLGKDVFTEGHISERTIEKAVHAFERFRIQLDKLGVKHYRAVATSASREAQNRELFFDRVRREAGIELRLLSGGEEARLVHLAVSRKLNLGDQLSLLVDIGGGSVELVAAQGDQVLAIESLKMGTVRLLTRLQEKGTTPAQFSQLAREYVVSARAWIEQRLDHKVPTVFVGTGGNVEALLELAKRLFVRDASDVISRQDLEEILRRLEGMNQLERIRQLDLKPDRADVIVPAAIVLQTLMAQLGTDQLLVPGVGLKDGVLEDLVDEHFGGREARLHRQQVLAAAFQMGRKYQFDERHARKVSDLSLQLFDQTALLHGLDEDYRFLLEIAALLHDIGKFVNFTGHHKHSQYLIESTPLVGLTDDQKRVVAALARYHRKSAPTMAHPFYRDLPLPDRTAVLRLFGLLRLAEALDAEHESRVEGVRVVAAGKNRLQLKLEGKGDLLLEKWAIHTKEDVLDKALGVRLVVAD